jgi:rhodanese-related sulfurtransferase
MADQATEHELAPARVSELNDAQLVDVRTPAEYEASHIEGALHLTLDDLQANADQLDRHRPLVFYCRTGERSAMAADAFRASGWDAYSITGGVAAWAERPNSPNPSRVL